MTTTNYTITATDGAAKAARLATPHGIIHTPVFMCVATAAAIKGAVDADDLAGLGAQVALCNTYHLHLRPGEGLIAACGGVGPFMGFPGPTLTDSGGFQVFSLGASARGASSSPRTAAKITDAGVSFVSHIDGRRIFMGPEESMNIQAALGASIAMAFDECAPVSERDYIIRSVRRTDDWLLRSIAQMQRLRSTGAPTNPAQLLFGINQGGTYADIRIDHARRIAALDMDGYAIGGLAVGESADVMYDILDATVPHLPRSKPTYLMGVGTPQNILQAVARGIDFFDCVLPARNGRHGYLFTSRGTLKIVSAANAADQDPIDAACGCPVCKKYSRAYIRHLFKAREMLAMRLAVIHNLYFYCNLMADIRSAIAAGTYAQFMARCLHNWGDSHRASA